MLQRLIAATLLMALAVACSPAAVPMTPTGAPEATEAASALEALAQTGAQQAAERPAWLSTPLINAGSGQTFTLLDFPNETVYIELMATWCTNCRIQQGNVRTVRGQLDASKYVFISLSVEPKDTTPALAQYAVNYGYPWTFAIMPPDMLKALVAQFGQTVTNPTSTPHFVISPAQVVSQLSTGIHTTDELAAELTAASAA